MATAAQIQAEAAALPQTQDALDALLVKYSPGDLAAAFPGYSQNDIDTARAAAEQREFINWQMQQPAPAGQGTVGDVFAAQGITDPKNDPRVLAQAQEQIDRAARRENLYAEAGVAAPDVRPWSDAPVPTGGAGGGAGGGTRPTAGGGTASGGGGGGLLGGGGGTGAAGLPSGGTATGAANPRIQSIQQWYNSNVGRTDPQAQSDLNRFLATSGFTAREINAALPQWGLNDLQNAMRTAIGEVAQQTPFAPAVTQPLAQPYTSIASQLPGGADARAQEIRNWYAANEGRTDPQAQGDLERFLASGYSAQEINRALPQFDVPFLTSGISAARQTYPDAALQRQLAAYQATAPGAQFTGTVSPYGLLTQQTQAFRNPYADTLANTALGGYNPGVYNILLDETIDPVTGIAVPVDSNAGGAGGIGGDGGEGGAGSAGTGTGTGGGMGNTGEGGGGPGEGGWAKGGLIDKLTGPDPSGPDDGYGKLQVGEYVIKKSAVKKYGQGLLDMINDGKVPAKKMKSLLG